MANNNTVGKLEKSNGLKACKATINTSKEISKFDVNNKSSNHGLKGITIMVIKIIIPTGILKVLIKLKKFAFSNCRKTKSILQYL